MTSRPIPPIPAGPSVQIQRMKHGDSVLVENTKVSGFRFAAKKLGVRIVVRKEGDTMTRIWKDDPIPAIDGGHQ